MSKLISFLIGKNPENNSDIYVWQAYLMNFKMDS